MARSVQFLIFSAVLISLRLVYVWIESSYNIALLDLMATPLLTSDAASEVQELGHKLAALGIALLLTPLAIVYALKGVSGRGRRFAQGSVVGIASFFALFVSGYNLQTWAMDAAVESASAETRYQAYYEVLFRQLYVDGAITDNGFSPTLETASHVMWLPFGANALADLPENLKQEASELVMERAQKQAALERFAADYEAYRTYQSFTQRFLDRYETISNEALAKVDPEESSTANLYGSFVESIYKLYPAYQSINKTYKEHLAFMASNQWLRVDVQNLFSASKNERQWRHRALVKKVGLNGAGITLDSWCTDNSCPGSWGHLKRVITAGLQNKYAAQAYGVPMGLNLREFLQAPQAFNRALKVEGNQPVFDTSKVTFQEFQRKLGENHFSPDVSEILSRWFPEAKGITIPAGLTDQQIVDSEEFRDLVKSKMGSRIAGFPVTLTKEEFFAEWLKASADILEKKRSVLLPENPEQMLEGDRVEAGLAAVRLLYIPPIAAAISGIMIVLNLAAIFSGLLSLRNSQWLLRCGFLAALIIGGALVGASAELPSPYLDSIWDKYASEQMLMDSAWETFFGVEVSIAQLQEKSDFALSASTINQAMDSFLGWAL